MIDSNVWSDLVSVIHKHPWLIPVTVAIIVGSFSFLLLILALRTNILHRYVGSLNAGQNDETLTNDESTEDQIVKKEMNFEQKMKTKSVKIVEAAEKGELKEAVERCKKFLSNIKASTFECKCEINSWEEIEGIEQFGKIVDNIGKTLKLPEDNINGIKLAASGKAARRDTLAFECAMRDQGKGKGKGKGKVRLHTGGYQVSKQITEEGEKIDFQIALHYLDMSDITFNTLPDAAVQSIEKGWFQASPAIETQKSTEGEDWNSYFQYQAHKNILQELNEE